MNLNEAHGPSDVIEFWFEENDHSRWFKRDADFDALISDWFGDLHERASRCELYGWRDTPQGRLAEIIVLDQFSRNIHREKAAAFASDPLALALAQEAIAAGADRNLEPPQRSFLYMPFMHSESLVIHDVATELFARNGDPTVQEFERKHRAIIERFGRYPHRNAALGRRSTAQELVFLTEPDSSF
ncbi:MAG: DUF924 family protein [Gammaproteobacteria bacterium]|jgi:uncharacterized protein (DUF924 family)